MMMSLPFAILFAPRLAKYDVESTELRHGNVEGLGVVLLLLYRGKAMVLGQIANGYDRGW